MAITGKFAADFSEFTSAVQSAETELRSFETGAANVQKRLNTVSDAFSGRRVMSEAAIATKAVEELGGATTLTATEQAKVNRLVTEAIAKYEALGQQAPADMLALAKATEQSAAPLEKIPAANASILSSVAPLAGAFGLAFSASSVINFGKEILADADALDKLAAKTGIAIEPLQALGYAAGQSGNTLEQVVSAVSSLQTRIAGGEASAIAAVQGLGIAMADFTAMTPDEQFRAVAREVATIEDPMERARVATELFGRAGREILPTLTADIDALGEAAPVMSEKAVKAFASMGDTFDSLWVRMKTAAGEGAYSIYESLNYLSTAGLAVVTGDMEAFRDASAEVLDDKLPKLPPALDAVTGSSKGVALSWEEMNRVSGELTTKAEAQIVKNRELATSQADIKREADALTRLQGSLFSRDAIDRAGQYQKALGDIGNVALLTKGKKEELKRVVDAAVESYTALGEKAPAGLLALATATGTATEKTFDLDAEIAKLHAKDLPAYTGLLGTVEKKLVDTTGVQAAFRSDVVFTAETIETEMVPALDAVTTSLEATAKAQLSWSDAMDAARRGEGTMGGSFAGTSLVGTPTADWGKKAADAGGTVMYDSYNNPYIYIPGVNSPTNNSKNTWASMGVYGARAMGGPVSAGGAYLVGERGPEMFVPQTDGRIATSAGGISVVVQVQGAILGTADQLARLVGDALVGRLRQQGVRLPASV